MSFLVYIAVSLAVQLLAYLAFGPYELWTLKWWVIVMASLLLASVVNVFHSLLKEILETLKARNKEQES